MSKMTFDSQDAEMNRVGSKILKHIAGIKEDIGDGKWPQSLESKGFTEEKELYGEMAAFLRDAMRQAFDYFVMQFVHWEMQEKTIKLDKDQKLATIEIYINPTQWDFSFKLVSEFDDDVSIAKSVLEHYKIKLEQEDE